MSIPQPSVSDLSHSEIILLYLQGISLGHQDPIRRENSLGDQYGVFEHFEVHHETVRHLFAPPTVEENIVLDTVKAYAPERVLGLGDPTGALAARQRTTFKAFELLSPDTLYTQILRETGTTCLRSDFGTGWDALTIFRTGFLGSWL
ncbi:hypothetical protein IHN63_17860, partial [Deinococcus sp. 6YEL10]|uniref:hypothetical protein n=1 Tax=Deinococcus sp. 6YEL10 TaxID=2745870 RepID=UPI001E6533DA